MQSFKNRFGAWCLLASLSLSPALFADSAHVAEDAHIDLGNAGDNNGTVPNLVVSNIVDRKTGERLTFLVYDLLPLPADASLEQAVLRLYVGKVDTPGDLDVYLVTEPWEEHTITGFTAPAFEAAPFTTFSVVGGDEGHFVTVDVTPEVGAWLNGAESNYGFVLAGNPATDVDVSFDSKENGQTSHQSELELVLGTAVGGIDSEDIADDSIGSEDIKDGSVSSDDIADGSVGAADVNKDAVQLRISGKCAAGSSIREIDNMGAVVCEPDDDSGGDITSVFPASGGGLEGGAASGDAELGIATGGVSSAMVADGAIGSADVDSSAVQLRIGGSCAAGSSIRSIAANGSVVCETDDDTDTTLDADLFWKVGGNGGTSPIPVGPHFVGTTDDTDLVLGINGMQGVRLSYSENAFWKGVNVLGGHPVNKIVNAIGATIGGGGYEAVVGGSDAPNKVEASFGTIGGGVGNGVLGLYGFIGGGGYNTIMGEETAAIAGGGFNEIDGESRAAFIGAGWYNKMIESDWAAIGGGYENASYASYTFIGGGHRNTIGSQGSTSFIGGGFGNRIGTSANGYGGNSAVVSGSSNVTLRTNTFIGGGTYNGICNEDDFPPEQYTSSDGYLSVVVGGFSNNSCGQLAFIGGGEKNFAEGWWSMIIGGFRNTAQGDFSLAAGDGAVAAHDGAFVWADALYGDSEDGADFSSQRINQFRIRATGGARFDVGDDDGAYVGGNQWVDIRTQANNSFENPADFRLIDTSTGAYLSLGGGWVNASDRNRKTDIQDIDRRWVLEQVVSMPVLTWRYKVEDERIRHIGPMAQDFQAAFGFGGDEKSIMTVDADGVALAAIQALYEVTRELERRTRQLEAQQQRLEALEAGLQSLEAKLDPFRDRRLAQTETNLRAE